ncbi:Hypothetical protein IALB_1069 [Ignavibacterium album JCM 16511]|uniref:Uncharacterized protein n=1 Tax=Ignavibacterium album (strain DSM 19864 / JCM 16511 / NBRC 101810 / Mat9-16) TaxID=945713 RepID=I0AIH3_IGNAJ|nr:Hypothetical protein IALB_1069 [Ignavibacterium album JCM 16511]
MVVMDLCNSAIFSPLDYLIDGKFCPIKNLALISVSESILIEKILSKTQIAKRKLFDKKSL